MRFLNYLRPLRSGSNQRVEILWMTKTKQNKKTKTKIKQNRRKITTKKKKKEKNFFFTFENNMFCLYPIGDCP